MKYGETALKLKARGLQTMPAKGKACYIRGWPRIGRQDVDRTEFEVYAGKYPNHNTALIMGVQCPLIAIDIDCDDAGEADVAMRRAFDLFGRTPLIRLGKTGARRMLFYRKAGKGHRDARGRSVEVFAASGLVILYGVHPSGVAYRWPEGNPIETPLTDAPEITAAQLAAYVAAIDHRNGTKQAAASKAKRREPIAAGDDMSEILDFVFEAVKRREMKLRKAAGNATN